MATISLVEVDTNQVRQEGRKVDILEVFLSYFVLQSATKQFYYKLRQVFITKL